MCSIIKYIDYNNMKEFYTIEEVCRLFELNKQELRKYSNRYEIEPQEDQYGNWGFRKVFVRKLHNYIYKEQKSSGQPSGYRDRKKNDPWE